MENTQRLPAPIRFGIFEVDVHAGELRRQGVKVRLQDQPFQVLTMLLERSGEVVTREELQKKLWPADTFVDFERGLNRAINKLREALADDADRPRFIETLPRRGYRFLVVVETVVAREVEESGRKKLAVLPSDRTPGTEALSTKAFSRRQILPWSVACILAVVSVIALLRPWRTAPNNPDRPFSQLDLDIGPDEFAYPAISPDGTRIVFVSKQGLAIRRLDQSKTTLLAGTEGAAYPFFSPNGRWVAFFQARKLQKIAVEGGVPIPLCDAEHPGGGSWGDDDNIVATVHDPSEGLSRVPTSGGMPQPLAASKAAYSAGLIYLWPQVLPGSKAILFAATNASGQGSLRIFTAIDGKTRTIVENSTYGRYLPSGYLIYYRRGTLFAAPMDARRLELAGAAVPLVDGVAEFALGRADFDVSSSGTLVYQRGTERSNAVLSWLYSSGKTTPVLSEPGEYSTPRLSPDGTRLALSVLREGKQNLWIYDLGRETFTRLTSENGPDSFPSWTADGEFVIFQTGNGLAWTRSDGSGKVERLAGISNAGPWSFSADGKWLAFWPLQPGSDLWVAPVERKPGVLRLGQPQPLLQQSGSQGAPAISPDDRWVAYTSDETGRFETYVMPFSPGKAADGKWQISNGGGWAPRWSGSGRELFYQNRDDQRVQVVSYTVKGNSFLPGKPRYWSEARASTEFVEGYDVAPDGKRLLVLSVAETIKPETHLRVLLNVDSELRRRTPSSRK